MTDRWFSAVDRNQGVIDRHSRPIDETNTLLTNAFKEQINRFVEESLPTISPEQNIRNGPITQKYPGGTANDLNSENGASHESDARESGVNNAAPEASHAADVPSPGGATWHPGTASWHPGTASCFSFVRHVLYVDRSAHVALQAMRDTLTQHDCPAAQGEAACTDCQVGQGEAD